MGVEEPGAEEVATDQVGNAAKGREEKPDVQDKISIRKKAILLISIGFILILLFKLINYLNILTNY